MELIFHIGAGKTGSSSIQQTLKNSSERLIAEGFLYTGLIFESNVDHIYQWQNVSKIEDFHALSVSETKNQLSNLLKNIIEKAEKDNINTIIWSNESFFGRASKVLSVLKEFEKMGHRIKIIAYVRRHDSWARSAYIQWGLKHKTYKGDIQPFAQWIKKRKPRFSKGIREVLDIFPETFYIRNMDVTSDVVNDFLTLCGISTSKIDKIRDNDSPGNEELFLRTLFNSNFNGQVLPQRFDNTLGRELDYKHTINEYMDLLLPSKEEIDNIRREVKEDWEETNEMLVKKGQPPLQDSPLPEKDYHVNEEKLMKVLCEIVLKQSIRINRLEALLKEKDV